MQTKNLYWFLVVGEELNITRAAERLYISQQSLSEYIQKLEAEFGTEFFVRGHGLSLTYAGKCMLETASQILSMERQLKNRLIDLCQEQCGELWFGLSYTTARIFLPHILPRFNKIYPNVELHVEIKDNASLEKLLISGSMDIVMAFERQFTSAKIEMNSIYNERLLLMLTRKRLRQVLGNEIDKYLPTLFHGADIKMFADQPFLLLTPGSYVRRIANDLFLKNQIVPHIHFEAQNADILSMLASESMGITFLPELNVISHENILADCGEDTLYAFPLRDRTTDCRLVLGRHRDHYISKLAETLITMIQDQCAVYRQASDRILGGAADIIRQF